MFYCGIDIGKYKHAVALLDERGKPHKPVFTIENTQAGLIEPARAGRVGGPGSHRALLAGVVRWAVPSGL